MAIKNEKTKSAKVNGGRSFKKVEAPDVIKFEEPGDSLQGEYLGRRAHERADGSEAILYDLRLDSGKKVAFWGAGFLNPLMDAVAIGAYIRVTLSEIKDPEVEGHSPSKHFEVEVAE